VFHYCAFLGSTQSFISLMDVLSNQLESLEGEKHDEFVKKLTTALNHKNSKGNTPLHEAVLADKQTIAQRLRRSDLVDQQILNNNNQTASDIENEAKEKRFKEELEKQAKLTKDRESREAKKERRRQDMRLEEEMEKERLEEERAAQMDPEAYQRKIQLFCLFFLVACFVVAYFLLDFVAKNSPKRSEFEL